MTRPSSVQVRYRKNDVEDTAAFTPVDLHFPWGDARRAGVVGDGVTDDTAALNAILSVAQAVYIPDPATSYLTTGIQTTHGARKIIGDGIHTRIRATGGHTLTVAAGDSDIVIEKLWLDQQDIAGSNYDALRLLAGECRVRDIDIDEASRYGIYIGAYRTHVQHVQMQNVLDTGIYILSTANYNTIRDVGFTDSGSFVPANCIDCQSDHNVISGIWVNKNDGYVLNIAGDYNSVTDVTALQAGGTTEDFVRVAGINNVLSNLVANTVTGYGLLLSGSGNQVLNLFVRGSSKAGARITGSDCHVIMRSLNAGTYGLELVGSDNIVDARIQGATTGAADVDGNNNQLRGSYEGNVTLDGNDNTWNGSCTGNMTVTGDLNVIMGKIDGDLTVNATANGTYIMANIGGTYTNNGTNTVRVV